MNSAVQDTMFRLVSGGPSDGWLRARSVARGLTLETRLISRGVDSTAIIPVGPDSIVRILSDGKLGYCRANTVRVSGHLDTLLIVDMEQRDEWCPVPSYRSGDFRNTFILANPRAVAIGDTISVCWITSGARGFRFTVEGWYTNPDRCPYDANFRQRSEPNMVLLRRLP